MQSYNRLKLRPITIGILASNYLAFFIPLFLFTLISFFQLWDIWIFARIHLLVMYLMLQVCQKLNKKRQVWLPFEFIGDCPATRLFRCSWILLFVIFNSGLCKFYWGRLSRGFFFISLYNTCVILFFSFFPQGEEKLFSWHGNKMQSEQSNAH